LQQLLHDCSNSANLITPAENFPSFRKAPQVFMRMKAAVAHGVNQRIVIEDVEIGDPRQGELLVKIVASGLCASDMNALDGKRKLVPFPAILGHEAAGVVISTGDLLLDEVIRDRINLDHIDEAFDQLKAGEGARSVLIFD
jgi:Zn-dependent alcohol dehydrogenase